MRHCVSNVRTQRRALSDQSEDMNLIVIILMMGIEPTVIALKFGYCFTTASTFLNKDVFRPFRSVRLVSEELRLQAKKEEV